MTGWRTLKEPEYAQVWDVVYRDLEFSPSTTQWPGFREPTPSVTHALPESWTEAEVDELYACCWRAFRALTHPGDEVVALDWQHECFAYAPHASAAPLLGHPFTHGIFPDGDYAITLGPGQRWGTLGHPWERTICVFGEALLRQLQEEQPALLDRPIRWNGLPL